MRHLLHYEKHMHPSSDKWVVFLHGAGGSIKTWKYQQEALKAHFNLLLIDLRDHGLSKNVEPEAESYTFDLVVSDINKVMVEEGVEKAHFVTLSFGSVLVQAYYDHHPERMDRMVVIGGIFNANWMIKGFVHLARFFNLFLSYRSMYSIFSYLLMPKKRNQLARRVYQQQARKLGQKEYVKWLGLYSEFFLLLKTFHQQKIGKEMLILMGEDDFLFLPSARKFEKTHKEALIEIIPRAGHICNIDKPEAANAIILAFLNSRTALE